MSSWLHQQACQSTKSLRLKSSVTCYMTNPAQPLGGHYQHRKNAATSPLSAYPRSTWAWCLTEQMGTHMCTQGTMLRVWGQLCSPESRWLISWHLCPSKGADPDRKFPADMRAHRAFSAFPCLPGVTIGVSSVSQNRKGADWPGKISPITATSHNHSLHI